eukprot:COSAG02_NODE_49609_length_325_cov_3.402655_2_plen_40_part_01
MKCRADTQNPKPQTQNLKPKTSNLKPKTMSHKFALQIFIS